MIYMEVEDRMLVILSPTNVADMMNGKPMSPPSNDRLMILFTPDLPWLGERIVEHQAGLTPFKLNQLVAESQLRPTNKDDTFNGPKRMCGIFVNTEEDPGGTIQ